MTIIVKQKGDNKKYDVTYWRNPYENRSTGIRNQNQTENLNCDSPSKSDKCLEPLVEILRIKVISFRHGLIIYSLFKQ